MSRKNMIRKTALAGILIAVAVVGSLFSFPILGSRCAPVQHLVNIVAVRSSSFGAFVQVL